MRILILDDDLSILRALSLALSPDHTLFQAKALDEAISIIEKNSIELMIADYDFGSKNIIHFLEGQDFDFPIVIISGVIDKKAAIQLLNTGVDFLLEKPLVLAELKKCILQMSGKVKKPICENLLSTLKLEINLTTKDIRYSQIKIKLTPIEFSLLCLFLERPNTLVTRSSICDKFWKNENVCRNTLDTHLVNLKRKIPTLKDRLESNYGQGFILRF